MRESVNGMISIAHVQLRDRGFNAYVSMCVITRNIHVFKYNQLCCDYDVFDSQHLASQFLQEPLHIIEL